MLAAVGHSSSGNEGTMYSSPDRIGQLAGDHHHEMLAAARQRQLRPERSRPAPPIPPPPPPPLPALPKSHTTPHPDPCPLAPRDPVDDAPYLFPRRYNGPSTRYQRG